MWPLLLACAPAPTTPDPAPVEVVPDPPTETIERLSLVAAGDLLPHRRVKATARALDDGSNHGGWDPVLADVAAIASAADLAFLNLESPVAPDAHQGLHGEVFNAPASLVDGIAAAGFDVVSLANNHVFDQGPAGLVETFTRAAAAGLVPVGAGPTCADALAARVLERPGFRVAVLAAADLVNIDGNRDDDSPCLFVAGPECTSDCGPDRDAVHFSLDTARLTAAVRAARGEADLVVVSFHWGDEYRTEPLPEYPELAQRLVDAGADLIVGHHPHVLQPVRRLVAADGRDAVVAFSLGNLVSDMASTYDPASAAAPRGDTRDGALLEVTWIRTDGARPVLDAVVVHPTWTTNNRLTRGDDDDDVRVRTHAALRADATVDAALLDLRVERLAPLVGEAWVPRSLRQSDRGNDRNGAVPP